MEPVRVMIVDDHPVFRQGLRDVLETENGFTVVGEAADGQVALDTALELEPDVVLMDINLLTMNGLQVTRKLKAERPKIKVIMLTGYDHAEQVFHAFRAGASSYCPKDILPEELVRIMRLALDDYYIIGDEVYSKEGLERWLENELAVLAGTTALHPEEMFMPLSPREMEILELVTKGMSNKEIAYKLGISHQTVKNHMTSILRKLDVDDRTQAAVYALGHGWVRLDDAQNTQDS